MIFVVFSAVLVILSAVFAILLSHKISATFVQVGNRIEELSKGNLSKQAAHSSVIIEMNNLLSSTDSMQSELSETIGEVSHTSGKLNDTVREVTALSQNCLF